MYNGIGTGGTQFAPSGTTRKWNNVAIDYGTGRATHIDITGLPANNSDFGEKSAEFYLLDPDDVSRRVFDIYNAPVSVFYPAGATNHPGGTTPNWYYYYKQTSAYAGAVSYDAAYTGSSGYCDFTNGQWSAFVGPGIATYIGPSTWGSPKYIDAFAWICRHEMRHVDQFTYLWGRTTDRNATDDADGDWLPDTKEATLNRGYYPTKYASYWDDVGYNENPIPDREDLCMRSSTAPYNLAQLWTNGSADGEDWADPGKNH